MTDASKQTERGLQQSDVQPPAADGVPRLPQALVMDDCRCRPLHCHVSFCRPIGRSPSPPIPPLPHPRPHALRVQAPPEPCDHCVSDSALDQEARRPLSRLQWAIGARGTRRVSYGVIAAQDRDCKPPVLVLMELSVPAAPSPPKSRLPGTHTFMEARDPPLITHSPGFGCLCARARGGEVSGCVRACGGHS